MIQFQRQQAQGLVNGPLGLAQVAGRWHPVRQRSHPPAGRLESCGRLNQRKPRALEVVNRLKGVSSRLLRKERPDLEPRYWQGTLLSPSYLAGSGGGASIATIRQYIEEQRTPP